MALGRVLEGIAEVTEGEVGVKQIRDMVGNRRGVTLAIVAVSMFMFLALAAVAIDLGMVQAAGAQAQRAADAAALAGASGFNYLPDTTQAVDSAGVRAHRYARLQTIRQTLIVAGEDSVVVIPDSQKVRVFITRSNVPTWFANTFGISGVRVRKHAAAVAAPGSEAGKCVKPFAVPDIWDEESKDAKGKFTQDVNGDKSWDPDENWQYNPNPDTYNRYNPDSAGTQTGYGSALRNGNGYTGDRGRPIMIKAQQPGSALTSGFFYPWRIGNSKGANDYKDNLTGCNPATVQLGVQYDIENGDMKGPTKQGIGDLVAQDPTAKWDPSGDGGKGAVTGVDGKYGDWQNSPRVIPLGLFNPSQIANIQGGGNLKISFNNIALFFLEGMVTAGSGKNKQDFVQGRFLFFASGGGSGGTTGTTIKVLRLVE